jgi:hypothetical protein
VRPRRNIRCRMLALNKPPLAVGQYEDRLQLLNGLPPLGSAFASLPLQRGIEIPFFGYTRKPHGCLVASAAPTSVS